MTRQMSIRRVLSSIVAAGLIAAAVYFALEYRRMDRSFHEWIDARPVTMAVDLSRPGNFSAPFRQTCQISHAEAFYLTVRPLPKGDRDNSQPLHGLDATITISDNDGNEIASLEMATGISSTADPDAPIRLAQFAPFANGDYTVTIDVRNGAAALSGTEQTVHAEYLLCGLERLPAAIARFLAFACGISGLTIGIIVTRGFVKYGLSTPKRDAA